MLVQPFDDIPNLEESCISLGVLHTPVVLIHPNHQDCRARRHTVLINRSTFILLFMAIEEMFSAKLSMSEFKLLFHPSPYL